MNSLRFPFAVAAVLVGLAMPVAASAQAVSGSEEVVVLPETITPTPAPEGGVGGGEEGGVGGGEEVLGETVERGDVAGNNLALTGTDVAGLAAIGGAAVVIGGATLLARRRSLA